jgi:predicted HTH transcriptional regulator
MDFRLLEVDQQQDVLLTSFEEMEFAKKISSLANSEGGILYIGISPTGKIKGVYPEEELENIPIVLTNVCSSSIVYSTEVIAIKNKLLVKVNVISQPKIAIISPNHPPEYYFRINGNIRLATKITHKYWSFQKDRNPISPCTESDLDMILNCIQNNSLSQIYLQTELPKSTVDVAISWLLYRKQIQMTLFGDKVIYQHSLK